ncbi:MAG: helix-turn-helix domain-containing protein [Nitrospira sp.]|nr:MAG: helix-turn-helix domain-containing protein [Nitrospira sp.]
MPNALDEFEAARYLGDMKVSTLRTWRVRGGGPMFTRVGAKLIRYPVQELDAFLAKDLRKSTSSPAPAALGGLT